MTSRLISLIITIAIIGLISWIAAYIEYSILVWVAPYALPPVEIIAGQEAANTVEKIAVSLDQTMGRIEENLIFRICYAISFFALLFWNYRQNRDDQTSNKTDDDDQDGFHLEVKIGK